ncbi:MAG: mechanosensitive ion channel [Acidimicrobiia bacterium]|nr:mechanosensitive ion channel [Acidimicrobiia bacterium]
MTIERWMIALALLLAGLAVGGLAGWALRRRLSREGADDSTAAVAGVTGLFVFWMFALVGALAALSMVNPATIEDVPRQALEYVPRLLAAGLIMIAGYALAIAAARVVGFGLERATGRTTARMSNLIRWVILLAAGILALSQLGVDTSVLLVLVGVLGLGLALSFSLLIALGGQDVARELAAGRYLKRVLRKGGTIEVEAISGTVVKLHPATIEIETTAEGRRHVPYSHLLGSGFAWSESPAAKD